ncbi:uncharacterized protein LOC108344344 [Vigna angularis]|uniref:uncharacterized protein LOC108344344 n=1 Tax=Phaseolus angularis TaxID=3914 RepID=UPI00080A300D|nr:uncharacterized protein LOC108344344 [Vigna angularis]
MSFKESDLWYDAMKDEMDSMASNKVWELVQLPNGVKSIGCRWVFKPKKDSKGNIERHKVCTRPDIAYVVGVLGRYQSNPGVDHWKAAKKSFISGLRVVDSISRPLKLYYDNSAAGFMAKNNKSGCRSKHIDIKYLAIRERVKEKKVVIEHISIEWMIVDPLTKGLPPKNFKDHVVQMGLGSTM